MKKITSALISVYHKKGLAEIVSYLHQLGVTIYSTGGTYDYITNMGIPAASVESITAYPEILGGRVKTLHPKIFGGILYRRNNPNDLVQTDAFEIPPIDLVIIDLYPFEETLAAGGTSEEIIENIDIGGVSLIRAAAKNFQDVMVVPSANLYEEFAAILKEKNGFTDIEDRKYFAAQAFNVTSHYDTAIFNYFNSEKQIVSFKESYTENHLLRYGENPHQKGYFYGDLAKVFTQLNGKAVSYNNLVDIDAAMHLIADFDETTFAILKHTNACGIASRENLVDAYKLALAGDPLSAYGGVLITNKTIDLATAEEMHSLFFEVLIAPDYQEKALEILCQKKNRIILKQTLFQFPAVQYKSLLNGAINQDTDTVIATPGDLQVVTLTEPNATTTEDLLFANKIVKHTKSNTIVLAKNKQLLGNGTGQTSRVDALKQAISKAIEFNKDLQQVVMASDAFFPFPDCVEIAAKHGIIAVIQPGGSINDKKSIDFCNQNGVSMVLTGIRHFKH